MFVAGLILSLLIGLSLGLLGGGGSILTVPVLHYVFSIGPHDAIAMSLVVVGFASLFALIPNARLGRVRWRDGLVFGATSMASAFAGARVGALLPGELLVIAFAALMLVVGVVMVRRAHAIREVPASPAGVSRLVASGIGVGLLTGVLGAGGGFIIVPALALVGGLAIREAVATSLLVIVMNSAAAFAGTIGHATLEPRVVVPVVAIAMLGTLVGLRLGRRLTAHQLQRGFGVFVITIGVMILIRELT